MSPTGNRASGFAGKFQQIFGKNRTVTVSFKKRRNLASKADHEQDKARRYDVLADKFEERGE
jgi:hypothetical protein